MAQKTKHLKQFLTFIILAGLLHSCQFEDEVVENNNVEQNKFKIEKKNFDELMKVPQFKTAFSKIPKQKTKSNVVGKTVMEHEYGFNISNSPATVLSVGSQLTTYTFHITRETLLPVNQFENLVVQVDSTGTTSSYITKYFLNAEPIYNTTDGEYSFNINHKELTPIVYNNAAHVQNRIWYTGSDGCTIITLMCDFGQDHPAGIACINNSANRDLYLDYDNSNCQSSDSGGGGPSDSGGATGSSGSGPGQNGGSNSTHVTGIYTTPLLPAINANGTIPCKDLKNAGAKAITNAGTPKTLKDNLINLKDKVAPGGGFHDNKDEANYTITPNDALATSFQENYLSLPGTVVGKIDFASYYGTTFISVVMHTHSLQHFSIPTLDDIHHVYMILGNNNMHNPATFTMYVLTAHGTYYAIKIEDTAIFRTWGDTFFSAFGSDDKITKERNDQYFGDEKDDNFADVEGNEKKVATFFKGKGLGLYKSDVNLDDWGQVTIDDNGNKITIPCK